LYKYWANIINPPTDSASDADQEKFFQEHDQQIFYVLSETFSYQAEKLRVKDKADRSISISCKEATEFLKTLTVLGKAIAYLEDKIKQGWQRKSLFSIIQSLLIQTNHAKLRHEGMQLLLLWINAMDWEFPEVTHLYASCINLSVFESFALPSPFEYAKSDCLGEDRAWVESKISRREVKIKSASTSISSSTPNATFPIISTPSPHTTADYLDLLHDILLNFVSPDYNREPDLAPLSAAVSLGSDSDMPFGSLGKAPLPSNMGSATNSLAIHWNIFKESYLKQLFPSLSKKFYSGIDENEGYLTCPPQILQALLEFVMQNLVDLNPAIKASSPMRSPSYPMLSMSISSQPKSKLRQLLLDDVENREYIHEIIRQSFLAPFAMGHLGKLGLYILRCWTFNNDNTPSFLQNFASSEGELTEIQAFGDVPVIPHKEGPEECSNIFIRRYIRYVQLMFIDKKDFVENVDSQVSLMREGIQYLRLLALESTTLNLTAETWRVLMTTLTDIASHTFGRPNKFAGIASPPLAEEICDSLFETIFYTWIYSRITTEECWIRLRECVVNSLRWNQVVGQWTKIVHKLTKLMSINVYGIDMEVTKLEDPDNKTVLRLRAASIQSSRARTSALSAVNSVIKSNPATTERGFTYSIADPSPLGASVMSADSTSQTPDEIFGIMSTTASISSTPTPLSILGYAKSGVTLTGLEESGSGSSSYIKSPLSDIETPIGTPVIVKQREGMMISKDSRSSMPSIHSMPSLEAITEKTEKAPIKIPSLNTTWLSRLNEFPNIGSAITWTHDHILFAWKNMICVIGDITAISTPTHFAEAVNCVAWVQDSLLKIRSSQPFDGVHMPYLFDFVAWFVKSAELNTEFNDGKASAIGCLCRLMCRRHDQRYPETLLPHFYKILFKELTGDDMRSVYAIINNCSKLFASGLPGSTMIIPTFLKCFKKLFSGCVKDYKIPETVRQNAITILFSLISVSNHFYNIDMPTENMYMSSADLPQLPAKPKKGTGSSSSLLSTTSSHVLEKSNTDLPVPLAGAGRKLSTFSSNFHIFSSLTSGGGGEHDASVDIKEISFLDLKLQIKDAFLLFLDWERDPVRHEKSPETHSMLLWGCASSKEVVDDCINALLDHLTLSNLKVVDAAVDGLALLAKNKVILEYMETSILQGVQIMFQSGATTKEIRAKIISRLLYNLLDWVVALPSDLFASPKMSLLVFEVLENALNISSESDGKDVSQSPTQPTERLQSNPGSVRLKAMRMTMESSGNILTKPRHGSNAKENGEGDDDCYDSVIKETAENVLLHIIHHLDHFPNAHGPALMNSQIMDPGFVDEAREEEKCLYFTFNDTTLVTVVEVPGASPLETRSRIIVRDVTGKYVWDSYLFYESLQEMKQRANRWEGVPVFRGRESNPSIVVQHEVTETKVNLQYDIKVKVEDEPVTATAKKVRFKDDEMPLYSPDRDGDLDMLGELLKYMGKKHPECFMNSHINLDIPPEVLARVDEEVKDMSRLIDKQVEYEKRYHEAFAASKTCSKPLDDNHIVSSRFPSAQNVAALSGETPQNPAIDHSMKTYQYAKPAVNDVKSSPFGRCRLFLSHFGHLNFDSLKEDYFHLLAKTPSLYRDIKGLDKKFGREVMKIAVVYVGPGQEDETVLLRNDGGSVEYQEFVGSLGWEIDISTHPGYLGGLERSRATGTKATYFCGEGVEIVFHDVTKMPTDASDPKQVKKKRHIGNDHVHIIWNEHFREYRRNTIGGDFGNAQIVVTPMSNGLYTIDVMRDAKVTSFGPLQNKMVLMVTSRHRVAKWTFEKFVETILAPSDDGGPTSAPPPSVKSVERRTSGLVG
ncbi:hypothetical protein BC829DRAFT_386568, partial [Chytridium lagenaria]